MHRYCHISAIQEHIFQNRTKYFKFNLFSHNSHLKSKRIMGTHNSEPNLRTFEKGGSYSKDDYLGPHSQDKKK